MATFDSRVLSAFGLRPFPLTWTLSGGSGIVKTVELLTVGTVGGKQVQGVAFNALTSPASGSGSTATLSAALGTTLRVDRAYQGRQMALIFTDESTSLFTVITSAAVQTLTANAFDSSWPELRRLAVLEYR